MNIQTLDEALKAIGPIEPYWDAKEGYWRFSHPLFAPLDVFDDTPEEVVRKYKIHLEEALAEYRAGKVDEIVIRNTPAWGGRRKGAGRPKGARGEDKVRKWIPADIARFLERPDGIEAIRRIIRA